MRPCPTAQALADSRVGGENRGKCVRFPPWRSHSPHRADQPRITSYTRIQGWFYPASPPPQAPFLRHTLPTEKTLGRSRGRTAFRSRSRCQRPAPRLPVVAPGERLLREPVDSARNRGGRDRGGGWGRLVVDDLEGQPPSGCARARGEQSGRSAGGVV